MKRFIYRCTPFVLSKRLVYYFVLVVMKLFEGSGEICWYTYGYMYIIHYCWVCSSRAIACAT